LVRPRKSEKLKVVAVRIDPGIERRLRLLAETSGRKPSFFLQQLIEGGISTLEERWLRPDLLAQVRAGKVIEPAASHAAPGLFDEPVHER
jgi:RHH-type transcriptional regulator, rel operon repressor / antitoxin RelB